MNRTDDTEVMRLWREAGLPEFFLGNGGTNDKLVAFAGLLRADLLASLREAQYFILAPAEDLKDGVLSRIRDALALAHPPTAIVDEGAVERALRAYFGDEHTWHVGMSNDIVDNVRNSMRAAISAALPAGDGTGSAIADIAAERKRQIEAEGWTPEHDDQHNDGSLGRAAGVYAINGGRANDRAHSHLNWWPWSLDWWKPTDRRRDLIKAGALIAAEIERLDRLSASSGGSGE